MTAEQVIAALRAHHERMEGDWTLLEEALAIDVLAIGLGHDPPGPPHRRIAYEVKVTRQDYRAELEAWPDKAQRALDYSHALYFVVPEGVLYGWELNFRPARSRLWVPREAGLLMLRPDGTVIEQMGALVRDTAKPLSDYEIALLIHQAWIGGRIQGQVEGIEAGGAITRAMRPAPRARDGEPTRGAR